MRVAWCLNLENIAPAARRNVCRSAILLFLAVPVAAKNAGVRTYESTSSHERLFSTITLTLTLTLTLAIPPGGAVTVSRELDILSELAVYAKDADQA